MLINVVSCLLFSLKITSPSVQPALTGYVDKPPMREAFLFMKLIPLSQQGYKNKGKYFAMVDDEWYDYLMQFRWSVNVHRKTQYAYAKIYEDNSIMHMHRVILCLPDDDDSVCDHIDRNGLNNQQSNLRKATHLQNMRNKCSWGSSRFIGVSATTNGKWAAIISVDGKQIWLGRFKNEYDAALARDEAAKKYFGEFASLNFN